MLSELSGIIKTLAAGESAGTCLNAHSCRILSQYIKSLETQTPANLNQDLEQALGAWEAANIEYHQAFQVPIGFVGVATSIALENAIDRETKTRMRVLEVYRNIKAAHAMGNE